MKQILVCIGLMVGMAFQSQQQEKEATIRLTKGEAEAIYQMIDDSPTPGSVRKPLLQKIAVAYEATWPQRPQQIMKDTSKPKKP